MMKVKILQVFRFNLPKAHGGRDSKKIEIVLCQQLRKSYSPIELKCNKPSVKKRVNMRCKQKTIEGIQAFQIRT